MRAAADAAGVRIVTGDTKVVDRGKADGVYINTAGIGAIEHDLAIGPANVSVGDAVILSGDIGRHGMAIMAKREGLEFESTIESDCAPLIGPVSALLEQGIVLHCMRDLTRGGLASGLVEIAESASKRIDIDESLIPVEGQVAAACEILGFDPLYVANEGCFVVFVPAAEAERALGVMRAIPTSAAAAIIGHVGVSGEGIVILKSRIGAERVVDLLTGEQLPRIC
jgi:hydrogenase expression/formation protein HypE